MTRLGEAWYPIAFSGLFLCPEMHAMLMENREKRKRFSCGGGWLSGDKKKEEK